MKGNIRFIRQQCCLTHEQGWHRRWTTPHSQPVLYEQEAELMWWSRPSYRFPGGRKSPTSLRVLGCGFPLSPQKQTSLRKGSQHWHEHPVRNSAHNSFWLLSMWACCVWWSHFVPSQGNKTKYSIQESLTTGTWPRASINALHPHHPSSPLDGFHLRWLRPRNNSTRAFIIKKKNNQWIWHARP